EAEHRGDVDDRPAGPFEKRRGRLAHAHRAVEVDVDDLLEDLRVHLLAPADDAGAIDHDVEGLEGGDEAAHRRGAAYVEEAVDDAGRAFPRVGFRDFTLRRAGCDDMGAGIAEGFRERPANAARAAGHQDRAALEPARGPISG